LSPIALVLSTASARPWSAPSGVNGAAPPAAAASARPHPGERRSIRRWRPTPPGCRSWWTAIRPRTGRQKRIVVRGADSHDGPYAAQQIPSSRPWRR